MKQFEIYLPKVDNDGNPVKSEYTVDHFADLVENFTTYEGTGYWRGKPEPVLIVRIVTDRDLSADIERYLISFKGMYEQEAGFYTESEITARLV